MIMKWLGAVGILSAPRRYMGTVLRDYYLNKGKILTIYDPQELQAFGLIRQIKEETQMLLTELEAYQIYAAVAKTAKVDGDIAEVGVYKGGSAKLICETTNKPVHLFDTFEGLPDICENDNPEQFRKGELLRFVRGCQGLFA
jgi:hypothetical protein